MPMFSHLSLVRQFPRLRKSFAEALDRYGWDRCSMSGTTLLIGLPPNADYRRTPLTKWSFGAPAVCFLEAPEQADFVADYVGSAQALTVKKLMVGTSHDYKVKDTTRHRAHGAVEALCRGHFPALRTLSLGDMEKLFNGSAVFGKLGDVTDIFAIAPQLESLTLHGNFELHRPVRHPALRSLSVCVQEIGGTEGPLSQQTVDCLLLSQFPQATTVSLALEEWDVEDYTVPERFFTHNGFPALARFEIDTLVPQAAERVAAWQAARNLS